MKINYRPYTKSFSPIFPQDDPFKVKTGLIKDTDNPEYNHRQIIEIDRKSRACQRIFKRQVLKCEVFSKG